MIKTVTVFLAVLFMLSPVIRAQDPPPPPPPMNFPTGERVNLGLYGGRVLDMAYDAQHQIVLAAVEAPQSVFFSQDSGVTWQAAFPNDSLEFFQDFSVRGFGGRGVKVLASDGYCYAQTNQEAGNLTSSQVSEDGLHWRTLLDPYLVSQFIRENLTGHPDGQYAILDISVNGATALVSARNYVFRTTDAGRSWAISVLPDSNSVIDEDVNSVDLYGDDTTAAKFYAILCGHDGPDDCALYRTDDGKIFTRLFVVSGTDTAKAFKAVVSHPYNGDTVWVAVAEDKNMSLNGLWRSFDGGSTWTQVYESVNPYQPPDLKVFVDSSFSGPDHIRLFMAGENKYSDDLGDTWTDFEPENNPSSPRVATLYLPLGHIPNTDIYFSLGDGAPARSKNGVEGPYEFVPEGIEGITIWDIAQVPNQPDKVYLATSVGLAYTSAFTDTTLDPTEKWAPPYGNYPINPNNGGNMEFTAVEIDPYNTSHIVAANGNGLFVSTTGGFDNDSWTAIPYADVNGLDEMTFKGQGGRVNQFAFITSDSIIAAAYCEHQFYGALLLSTDGGNSWSTMPQAGTHSFRTVVAAWNSAHDSLVLFAAGGSVNEDPVTHNTYVDSGAVYRSTDWGATWVKTAEAPKGEFNPQPYALPINDMMAKPGSLDTLYMACGENLSNAIVRTFDGGLTLESISLEAVGMFEGAFEAVAINKNHPDSIYFAVRRDIIVYDADSNKTTPLFRGYPGELTHTLLYDDLTMGSSAGFYEVKNKGTGSVVGIEENKPQLPERIQLKQNYPNPFNPSTTISFYLPQRSKVVLEIYNILGQRLKTLVAKSMNSGWHDVRFRAQELSSGIYFYRLQVQFKNGRSQVLSKKLVLLK